MGAPRVLIVDDHPINLELISLLLSAEGFDVVEAVDAEQALDLIEGDPPDLFVLDVQLPGMSGLDLLRLLRAQPETENCCAVIVTSYAMESDRAVATEAGCDSYFTKPIDTRTFGPEVRKVYEQGRRRRACGHSL